MTKVAKRKAAFLLKKPLKERRQISDKEIHIAKIKAYQALKKEHRQLAEELEMSEMQLDVKRRRLHDLSARMNTLVEEILAEFDEP